MDTVRGYDDARTDGETGVADHGADHGVDRGADNGASQGLERGVGDASAATLAIGTDERRMHVRAYNHWVSLLDGRPYPSIERLDPASIADFGPHSVLLDFSRGIEDPGIAFLGSALREECGLDQSITRIAQVPARSLLSRLTDHYLQIIANRAPIGFEAEFVGTRGHNTLYRGILMPFASDGDAIDYIYGVINWKEMVDAATQATLVAELDAAVRAAPAPAPEIAVWADGPSAGVQVREPAPEPADDVCDAAALLAGDSLADRLMIARESAAVVRAADTRTRAALYRALGRAHDFALASARDTPGYAGMLADAGLKMQARAPMTPLAKLVFGADYDKTRLTEFACVLSHAARAGVGEGALGGFLESQAGGIKAIVVAERAARRPATAPAPVAGPGTRVALATVTVDTGANAGEIVILVGRVGTDGRVDIVGVARDEALTQRAVRALD